MNAERGLQVEWGSPWHGLPNVYYRLRTVGLAWGRGQLKWLAWLVAAAAEDRLSFRQNSHTSFAALKARRWPQRANLWRERTRPRAGSVRLRDISPKVMWEKQRTSTFSHHRRVKRLEFNPLCYLEALAGHPPAGASFLWPPCQRWTELIRP